MVPTYTHDGLTFDYRDAGSGEPVVLLHGFPEDAHGWQHVASRLQAAGLRTLAPEQRGHSPGARPPRRGDYTLDKLSGRFIELDAGHWLPQNHPAAVASAIIDRVRGVPEKKGQVATP